MKISDIIQQLQYALPIVEAQNNTSYFSDVLTINSLTSSGTTVTAVVSSNHGLTTGDIVNIRGAKTPIPIGSLTQVDNIATAITSGGNNEYWDDLTLNYQTEVEIFGAIEPEYNGTHTLLAAQNRKKFSYQIAGNPSTPATGSPFLLEELQIGYNGVHEITVVDATTFTYQTTTQLGSPASGTIKAYVRTRVSGAVTAEMAINAYTKQSDGKYWAFVIMNDASANKDRRQSSDVTANFGHGESYRQILISPFTIYVFAPSTGSIAARLEQDSMITILVYLCKSLLRFRTSINFTEAAYSGAILLSHGFFTYDNAYYVHQFSFETNEFIIYDDTIDPDYNVAFRDIILQFKNDNDQIVMDIDVDLDDEILV